MNSAQKIFLQLSALLIFPILASVSEAAESPFTCALKISEMQFATLDSNSDLAAVIEKAQSLFQKVNEECGSLESYRVQPEELRFGISAAANKMFNIARLINRASLDSLAKRLVGVQFSDDPFFRQNVLAPNESNLVLRNRTIRLESGQSVAALSVEHNFWGTYIDGLDFQLDIYENPSTRKRCFRMGYSYESTKGSIPEVELNLYHLLYLK